MKRFFSFRKWDDGDWEIRLGGATLYKESERYRGRIDHTLKVGNRVFVSYKLDPWK